MKLMFDKETLEGRWFRPGEKVPDNYTEKVPPHAGVIWSEEAGDFVLKPEPPEPEEETDNE
jgi:hypothetical protein